MLEESLHMLFLRAFHARRNYLRPSLTELGFGSGQPKLVDYLDIHGPCRQRELAEYFEIDPAAVSRMLDSLEKRGYVVRRVSDGSRRCDQVAVTEAGRRAAAEWRKRRQETDEVMLRGFTPEERRQLEDFLARAYRNLRAERGGEPPCES